MGFTVELFWIFGKSRAGQQPCALKGKRRSPVAPASVEIVTVCLDQTEFGVRGGCGTAKRICECLNGPGENSSSQKLQRLQTKPPHIPNVQNAKASDLRPGGAAIADSHREATETFQEGELQRFLRGTSEWLHAPALIILSPNLKTQAAKPQSP